MGTKWVEADSSEGQQATRMSEGYHRAKVTKVIRRKKNGDELRTDKGAFMMLVMEDATGEAAANLFLTEKAAWKAAKTFSRLGIDLKAMEDAGVDISRFEDETFAKKQLIGREGIISVEHAGKYCNVEFFHADELPIDELARLNKAPDDTSLEDEDIPFDLAPTPR